MVFQPVLLNDYAYELRTSKMGVFHKHWHSDLEILYCTDGSFGVCVDQTDYTLERYDMVLVGSSEVHEIHNRSESASAVVIRLGSLFCGADVFKEIVNKRFETPILKSDPEIKDIFAKIIPGINCKRSCAEELEIRGLMHMLLSTALKKLPVANFISEEHRKRLAVTLKIQKALDLVAARYGEDITLEDVTHALGYEKSAFCRMFKNATGCTFHKYLNDYRIKKAIMLLEEDHYSIAEISEVVGFSQQKHFSRLFKNSVGITPSEYRRNHRRSS